MPTKALILFILVGASLPLPGDTSTATLTGTITDSGGGVLPGAVVIAQDIDTGVARSTTTNPSGVYLLLGLQAGRYQVSASCPQFSAAKRAGLILRVNDEVRIDLSLTPGENRESVVWADSASVEHTECSAATAEVGGAAIDDPP